MRACLHFTRMSTRWVYVLLQDKPVVIGVAADSGCGKQLAL